LAADYALLQVAQENPRLASYIVQLGSTIIGKQEKAPCDPNDLPDWAKEACDKNKDVRVKFAKDEGDVLYNLVDEKPDEALRVLTKLASDPEKEVRAAVAGGKALFNAVYEKPDEALPVLTKLASDPETEVRAELQAKIAKNETAKAAAAQARAELQAEIAAAAQEFRRSDPQGAPLLKWLPGPRGRKPACPYGPIFNYR